MMSIWILLIVVHVSVTQNVFAEQDRSKPPPDPFADPLFWKYYFMFTKSGPFANDNLIRGIQNTRHSPTTWPILDVKPSSVPTFTSAKEKQHSKQAPKDETVQQISQDHTVKDSTSKLLSFNHNALEKKSEVYGMKDTVGKSIGFKLPPHGNSNRMERSLVNPSLLESPSFPSASVFQRNQNVGHQSSVRHLLPTLALTGALEGVNPLLLYHLTQGSQTQGSVTELLPLLALSGGGENTSPLLMHRFLSSSNRQIGRGMQNISPHGTQGFGSTAQPSSIIQDMLPLIALSGGGENTNPLLLHTIMSQSNPNQGGANMLQMIALTGGSESPIMGNPALMYHMMQPNRQTSGLGGQASGGLQMNSLLPFLLGGEAMSGNPILMMTLLGGIGSGGQSYSAF